MINKLTEAQAELVEALTKFQDKYECDHAELVQVVGYALDEIKNPPTPTGTLTPKGEAELKEKQDAEAKKTSKTSPPPAPNLNLATAK